MCARTLLDMLAGYRPMSESKSESKPRLVPLSLAVLMMVPTIDGLRLLEPEPVPVPGAVIIGAPDGAADTGGVSRSRYIWASSMRLSAAMMVVPLDVGECGCGPDPDVRDEVGEPPLFGSMVGGREALMTRAVLGGQKRRAQWQIVIVKWLRPCQAVHMTPAA